MVRAGVVITVTRVIPMHATAFCLTLHAREVFADALVSFFGFA